MKLSRKLQYTWIGKIRPTLQKMELKEFESYAKSLEVAANMLNYSESVIKKQREQRRISDKEANKLIKHVAKYIIKNTPVVNGDCSFLMRIGATIAVRRIINKWIDNHFA